MTPSSTSVSSDLQPSSTAPTTGLNGSDVAVLLDAFDALGAVWGGVRSGAKSPFSTRPTEHDEDNNKVTRHWSVHAQEGHLERGRALVRCGRADPFLVPSSVRSEEAQVYLAALDPDKGASSPHEMSEEECASVLRRAEPFLVAVGRRSDKRRAHLYVRVQAGVPTGNGRIYHLDGSWAGEWRGVAADGKAGYIRTVYEGEADALAAALVNGWDDGPAMSAEDVAAWGKPRPQPPPPRGRTEKRANKVAGEERNRILAEVFSAVARGDEGQLDRAALVERRRRGSTHPERAADDVDRMIADAIAKRKSGDLQPSTDWPITAGVVESWCASGQHGCSYSPISGKPVLPWSEWGHDCAMALMGRETRINQRGTRPLEWRETGEAGGSWEELTGDDMDWFVRETARRVERQKVGKSGDAYYVQYRPVPASAFHWLRANCRHDEERRVVDPFLVYVRACWEEWKRAGQPRDLSHWMSEVFVFPPDAPLALYQASARIPLIGAVSRALRPGAVADVVVVLRGPQGLGKSRTWSWLFRDPDRDVWFSDDIDLRARSKELVEAVGGSVLVEAAELSGMRKADVEHLKSLVSRRVPRFRRAYGHFEESYPLRSVLVGTTNDEHPLPPDPTGNRRWLVVTVSGLKPHAYDQLDRMRTMLWGEAYQAVLDGELAIVPPEVAGIQRQLNDTLTPRGGTDDLLDLLHEDGQLDGRTIRQVREEMARYTFREVDDPLKRDEAVARSLDSFAARGPEANAITQCLVRLGYLPRQGRVDGVKGRRWFLAA